MQALAADLLTGGKSCARPVDAMSIDTHMTTTLSSSSAHAEYVLAYSCTRRAGRGRTMAKTAKTEQNTRTSLNLPPDLVTEARAIAIREHTSLSQIVADYLRQYVKDHARGKK